MMPNDGGVELYKVVWSKELVGSILSNAWRSLSNQEKRSLFGDVSDDALKLAIFVMYLRDRNLPVPGEAAFLCSIARYVPKTLRGAFDRWVQAHYSDEASSLLHDTQEGAADTLRLLALTGDIGLGREAEKLMPTFEADAADSLPIDTAVLLARATTDRKFFVAALDSLGPRELSIFSGVSEILQTIAIHPNLIDERALLELSNLECNPEAEGIVRRLAARATHRTRVIAAYDRCLLVYKQLEPGFRNWLSR